MKHLVRVSMVLNLICFGALDHIQAQEKIQAPVFKIGNKQDEKCVARVMKEAKVVPFFENGQPAGLLIKDFSEQSEWGARGFKKEDVIIAIDATPTIDVFSSILVYTAICKNNGGINLKRKNKSLVLKPI